MEELLRKLNHEIRCNYKGIPFDSILGEVAFEIYKIERKKPSMKTVITKDGLVQVDTARSAHYVRDGKAEYAISITGKVLKMDILKNVLWSSGCHPVIATQRPIGDLITFKPTKQEVKNAITVKEL